MYSNFDGKHVDKYMMYQYISNVLEQDDVLISIIKLIGMSI